MKLWPFEVAGALGTAAAAKALGGSGGLLEQVYLGSPLERQHRGVAKNSREYYRKGWSPSPLPSVPV